MKPSFSAEIVAAPDEEVRLLATHEIDVAQGAIQCARFGGRPDEARRAVAQQVDDIDG